VSYDYKLTPFGNYIKEMYPNLPQEFSIRDLEAAWDAGERHERESAKDYSPEEN